MAYHKDDRNNDPEYSKFRREVLRRDKYCCQMPGCKTRRKLEVHHIIPYSQSIHLRTNIDDGITLCVKCHRSIKNKEMFFGELFMKIIAEKKR